jgi:hypothetical protein
MNTPTPTPRTDAAWAKTFEDDDDQCRAGNAASQMRNACATLERELAAASQAYKCAMAIHGTVMEERDRLAAELGTERARLNYMNTRGFEHRHHETGDHLSYEWTISSTNELKDVGLREVIDAAMKESAK